MRCPTLAVVRSRVRGDRVTGLRLLPVALALAGATTLVGCGGVRVETRTVQTPSCVTAKAMSVCVGNLVRAGVKAAGDIATVKVACVVRGAGFSCLRFLDYGSDVTDCARWRIRWVRPGIPFLVGGGVSYDCDRWTT